MALAVDISVLGDKSLERKLGRLTDKTQKRLVRKALRRSGKRIWNRVLLNASGVVINEDTGALVNALEETKPVSRSSRGVLEIGFKWPTRAALGIPPTAKGYYPTALEYGTRKRPPRPFVRRAVNANMDREIERIRRELVNDVLRQFAK